MKRCFPLQLLAVVLLCSLSELTVAQSGGARISPIPASGVSHKLYGDFKVDESKAEGKKPGTFQIVLYTLTGQIVGRQNISNNGRYYFHDVANGEYNLVVELEGTEVARLQAPGE
jgi:hypothetical protein